MAPAQNLGGLPLKPPLNLTEHLPIKYSIFMFNIKMF